MSLLSQHDMQSETDRLRRYRDAQCESEYEYPEPEIKMDTFAQRVAFVIGGVLASWLTIGLIAIWALR